MALIMQSFEALASLVASSWWIWHGVAHGLVFLVIGRLMIWAWREHAYLWQMSDRRRALDTWIEVLLPVVSRLKLQRFRTWLEVNLSRAGTRPDWTTSHFIACQLVWGLGACIVTWFFLCLLLGMPIMFALVVGLVGFSTPLIRLTDQANARYLSVSRELPFFIDYLSLAMGAGLDFNQGLSAVVADAPKSPLRDEFGLVLRNIKLGMTREEALLEMERRINSPALRLFVQTLVQAMRMGSDVVQTLIVMSETIQGKRFQDAEEKAGKISVRMMIPMMLFVMPATMIILLGPMLLEWLQTTI
jgi:tight adherence protein C